MSYRIHITSTAERDIMSAADYIEFTLKKPKAADDLLDEAEAQINSLSELPEKFRLVDDPVLASWEIRFVIIKNYLAFYTIDKETQTVIVVRFLYQKSNWNAILRKGFSLI
ncbi:MAG: type II toxin-antitoxin system RelE/ParE family toxin [Clostridiaceae bacterium]|nr:type II toxin-antitoxin system RelE/ParE family toxin [Clostridiaceae bacterium]